MQTIPRICVAASLAVLCLALPAAGWSQDSQDNIALPVKRLPVAEKQTATRTQQTDGHPAAGRTLAERVANLRQHVERLAILLDKQTNRSDRRLAEQAQRITQLEQKIVHLHNRLQRPRAPADEQATAAAQARTTNAVQTGSNNNSADTVDTAGTTGNDTEASADSTESDDAAQPGCTSTLDNRFLFDVFFQADTYAELASAADTVQAIDLRDWFVLPDLHRLYVGRYGTCHLAERRQADIHARTGLALTIDAVEDTDDNADAAAHEADTVATESAPFFIVGVEFRGTQAYLGMAHMSPRDLTDITWLQPGQAYEGWYLRAIHTHRGIATFAVHGRAVSVRLSQ